MLGCSDVLLEEVVMMEEKRGRRDAGKWWRYSWLRHDMYMVVVDCTFWGCPKQVVKAFLIRGLAWPRHSDDLVTGGCLLASLVLLVGFTGLADTQYLGQAKPSDGN